jgi:hypothetical protein
MAEYKKLYTATSGVKNIVVADYKKLYSATSRKKYHFKQAIGFF